MLKHLIVFAGSAPGGAPLAGHGTGDPAFTFPTTAPEESPQAPGDSLLSTDGHR